MKSILTILFLMLFVSNSIGYGQSENAQTEEISIKKSILLGPQYYQGEDRISTVEVGSLLKSNPKAHKLLKQTSFPKVLGNVFGAAGGFIIGWQLASIESGRRDVLPIIIGSASILSGLVFESYANKTRRVAIGIYNKGLQNSETGYLEQPYLHFTGNGICLTF
jgi:hypothetical protein